MSTIKATILIADDDALVRSAYQAALERAGHRVYLAEDGSQAIALLERQQVDIVLLDILMPNKEGIETLIELKRRFPDLTVFVMSGGTSRYGANFLEIAAKFGAAATLKKPFKPQVLLDLIESMSPNSRAGTG